MDALLEFVFPVQLSALTVGWIHFVALAVASPAHPSAALACRYEYLFWGAIGLMVISGLGNVGILAPGVPDVGSRWGRLFALKLLAVFGLIVSSLVRTGILVRTPPDASADRRWYALTAGWTIVLVARHRPLVHPVLTSLGRAVAGYLEGGTTSDGMRVGAIAGVIMLSVRVARDVPAVLSWAPTPRSGSA